MNARVTYTVTFKYDLGGPIGSYGTLVQHYRSLNDGSDSRFDLTVFNFSYVSTRELPVLVVDELLAEPGTGIRELFPSLADNYVQLVAGVQRRVWVYPQGVLSIDYVLGMDELDEGLLRAVMHELPREKNRDYLPYLRAELPKSMFAKIERVVSAGDGRTTTLFDNAAVVCTVQEQLSGLVRLRPYRYVFHDYRQLVLLRAAADEDLAGHRELLKSLATMEYKGCGDVDYQHVQSATTEMFIGTWCACAIVDAEAPERTEENILVFFNHVHKNWYLCQLWVFALDSFVEGARDLQRLTRDGMKELKRLRREMDLYQANIEYDLSEIFDVDLIVKDYSYTRLLQALFKALNLYSHHELLVRRRQELDRYYGVVSTAITEQVEADSQRHSFILENFFAAITIFSMASVLFEMYASDVIRNLVIIGSVVSLYALYFTMRIRGMRRHA